MTTGSSAARIETVKGTDLSLSPSQFHRARASLVSGDVSRVPAGGATGFRSIFGQASRAATAGPRGCRACGARARCRPSRRSRASRPRTPLLPGESRSRTSGRSSRRRGGRGCRRARACPAANPTWWRRSRSRNRRCTHRKSSPRQVLFPSRATASSPHCVRRRTPDAVLRRSPGTARRSGVPRVGRGRARARSAAASQRAV